MSKQVVHIIDDDEADLFSIGRLVKSAGLTTRTHDCAISFLDNYEATPGCILVDLRMPKMDGLELQSTLNKRGNTMPIIFITGYGDVSIAVKAMKNGATDFIEKPCQKQELLDSIKSALELDQTLRNLPASTKSLEQRLASLTQREHEVMGMLKKGQTNKEIGKSLEISPRTVEVHRRNIMHKLEIKSAAELIKLFN